MEIYTIEQCVGIVKIYFKNGENFCKLFINAVLFTDTIRPFSLGLSYDKVYINKPQTIEYFREEILHNIVKIYQQHVIENFMKRVNMCCHGWGCQLFVSHITFISLLLNNLKLLSIFNLKNMF